ncbi:hypothetical protein KC326_g134 [Hortaea werneckii]|nr:hypothetical protein KC326_g134 [Hortaea werneckii]
MESVAKPMWRRPVSREGHGIFKLRIAFSLLRTLGAHTEPGGVSKRQYRQPLCRVKGNEHPQPYDRCVDQPFYLDLIIEDNLRHM